MILHKFNFSVPWFLICRIGETLNSVGQLRINEILVHFPIDGDLDFMKFSNVCNIPDTEPGTKQIINVITNN